MTLFAACTESPIDPTPQTPGSSRSYIFFEPVVEEQVQTRTNMVTGTTLPDEEGTAFGVYGYAGNDELFNKTEVYRTTDGTFSYEGLVGWKDATTTHNFYAYYPCDLTTNLDNNDPYIVYNQPDLTDDMVDILTATSSRKKGDDPVVALTFYHRLWALDITVKNNREERDQVYDPDKKGYNDIGNDVKINSITIEFDQIPAKGNIYMDGNVSTEGTKSFIYSEVYSEPLTLTAGTLETLTGENPFLFLPCVSFNYRITLECISTFGTDYTIHHPHTYVADEMGKPILDADNQVQWDWATAAGPNAAGFAAGHRYTLDIVKSDFNTEIKWGNSSSWEEVKVDHVFN